jgi:DNA replication and repair protein RecF
MHLSRIQGENFRLFERFELAPNPGLNLILGANASGKTSLLEALYSLGRGSSFRGTPAEACGRAGPQWLVHGRVSPGSAPESALGVAWTPDGLRMRIDQADVTMLDLVRRFPVQILEPDSHRLLEDGPAYRRRYLDWGVFHVEHRFYPVWRRYQRALKQRNHSLKAGQTRAEIEAWNAELAGAGEAVQEFRAAQLELLRGRLGEEIRQLLGPVDWTLELACGWPAEKPLVQTLADHYEHDRRQGKTGVGPHRAELKLKLAGRGAKHQVSRGQQKLLIAALLLSQARLIAQRSGASPALLVDDFPAELGQPFQQALLAALTGYPGQVFVTSIERTEALKTVPENAVFHVEHGSVGPAKRV